MLCIVKYCIESYCITLHISKIFFNLQLPGSYFLLWPYAIFYNNDNTAYSAYHFDSASSDQRLRLSSASINDYVDAVFRKCHISMIYSLSETIKRNINLSRYCLVLSILIDAHFHLSFTYNLCLLIVTSKTYTYIPYYSSISSYQRIRRLTKSNPQSHKNCFFFSAQVLSKS